MQRLNTTTFPGPTAPDLWYGKATAFGPLLRHLLFSISFPRLVAENASFTGTLSQKKAERRYVSLKLQVLTRDGI
ncbi:hypothetical protein DL766_003264 [Monosporascus sp. MC13-8B]|uniref:Uncharacterized protein n=1 Tax=Monosporascus cannonballus TaxID=155416 RepID=A0ABY0HB71_9PEZI|nr:hypothetical protein DL762_003227 [Monosporascus cannonballus]RYP00820.1 hypothetical protein DL763_000545 [Monosporascus cannonballus]RYP33823.1 hypothetical protein DL766_003264 [Monosporascus sp. MC13-8B]